MNYYQIEPEENTFETIMVDVTHRCNMTCFNCYLPNRTIPDMPFRKLIDFVNRLPNRTFIRLIGAEPTLRNDLPEIIYQIKKRGHRVSVTTNGLKLSDKNYVKELKQSGLRLVLLSMNGADDDSLYKAVDNMACAEKKVSALKNCVELSMIINTGTIISRNTNEAVIKKQIALFKGFQMKVKPVLRFRTIGLIGRNQGSRAIYSETEFKNLIHQELRVDDNYIKENLVSAHNNTSGVSFFYENIIIRLVDWTVDTEGVPDPGNIRRGRITENWKLAPFFEDVKRNEFGY